MKLVTLLGCAVLCAATALSAAAKPVIWRCDVAGAKAPYKIPPTYIFNYDAAGQTLVFDGLIKSIKKEPIPATVKDLGDRITFSWVLNGLYSRNAQSYSLRYRLTVVKKTMKMSVTESMLGYDNPDITQKGSCKPIA